MFRTLVFCLFVAAVVHGTPLTDVRVRQERKVNPCNAAVRPPQYAIEATMQCLSEQEGMPQITLQGGDDEAKKKRIDFVILVLRNLPHEALDPIMKCVATATDKTNPDGTFNLRAFQGDIIAQAHNNLQVENILYYAFTDCVINGYDVLSYLDCVKAICNRDYFSL